MRSNSKYFLLLLLFPAILIYKNPGNITLWFFGDDKVSAIALILFLFLCGIIFGILLTRAFTRPTVSQLENEENEADDDDDYTDRNGLSREDRDYIN